MGIPCFPPTAAVVNMTVANNVTWADALQFGVDGDTSWSFNNKTFKLEVKASRDDVTPLLTLTSPTQIVVDDATLRVLHFNVDPATVNGALAPGKYVYDFIMVDDNNVKTMLMAGHVLVVPGVTED
jgi:hypothetical protein